MDKNSGLLQRDDSALVVIDVQERLAAVMAVRERVVSKNATLIKGSQLLGVPVLYSEQYPKGLGSTVPELAALLTNAMRLEKRSFSACREGELQEWLRREKRAQVILTGMETHVCVLQTAMDLAGAGFGVFVAADAVCSRHKLDWEIALRRIANHGVTVTTTESILFEWLESSAHSDFKAVSQLIK